MNVSSELVLFDDISSLGLLDSCSDVERSQHVKLISRHFRDRLMNFRSCGSVLRIIFLTSKVPVDVCSFL